MARQNEQINPHSVIKISKMKRIKLSKPKKTKFNVYDKHTDFFCKDYRIATLAKFNLTV